MATRVRINAEGVAQIQAAANRYRDQLTNAIADDMRRLVPVLSGDLRKSIRTEFGPMVARIYAGDVAAGVDYHLYQEYGTSRMAAQPFIRPAVYLWRGL
jgi:HK97 gp10 family phage protein